MSFLTFFFGKKSPAPATLQQNNAGTNLVAGTAELANKEHLNQNKESIITSIRKPIEHLHELPQDMLRVIFSSLENKDIWSLFLSSKALMLAIKNINGGYLDQIKTQHKLLLTYANLSGLLRKQALDLYFQGIRLLEQQKKVEAGEVFNQAQPIFEQFAQGKEIWALGFLAALPLYGYGQSVSFKKAAGYLEQAVCNIKDPANSTKPTTDSEKVLLLILTRYYRETLLPEHENWPPGNVADMPEAERHEMRRWLGKHEELMATFNTFMGKYAPLVIETYQASSELCPNPKAKRLCI